MKLNYLERSAATQRCQAFLPDKKTEVEKMSAHYPENRVCRLFLEHPPFCEYVPP